MKAASAWRFLLLLATIDVILCSTYSRTQSYREDVVVTCNNKDDRKVKIMMNNEGVDVWKVHPSGTVQMQMDRRLFASVHSYVRNICHVSIENVEEHVQAAEAMMLSNRQKYYDSEKMVSDQEVNDDAWFEEYHDFAAITKWYKKLSEDNPRIVRLVESIGKTEEGRDISAVHITAAAQSSQVPKFYFQCLIHAREWISGATCMYQAKKLVDGYETDQKITKMLKSMEFIIVPVVNPDGYAYTWSNDRMWRKNRAKISSSRCRGVDLNRNFPVGWTESQDYCSVTYPGVCNGSEPEVAAVMNYYTANVPIAGAVDFHSFGQLILRPWGFEGTSKDEAVMAEIGDQLSNKIQQVNGIKYTSQKSFSLYEARGLATDWFYGNHVNQLNALAYTLELRDEGDYGFLLPMSQIKETCEEAHAGFLYLAEIATKRYTMMMNV